MTREDVVEAMADAMWSNRYESPRWKAVPEVLQKDFRSDMSAALSALESLGIALVPVEPTDEMMAGRPWAPMFQKDIYGHMLSASPLRKTEEA